MIDMVLNKTGNQNLGLKGTINKVIIKKMNLKIYSELFLVEG